MDFCVSEDGQVIKKEPSQKKRFSSIEDFEEDIVEKQTIEETKPKKSFDDFKVESSFDGKKIDGTL